MVKKYFDAEKKMRCFQKLERTFSSGWGRSCLWKFSFL